MKLINKLIDALAKLFLIVTSDVTPSHENPDRYNVEIDK